MASPIPSSAAATPVSAEDDFLHQLSVICAELLGFSSHKTHPHLHHQQPYRSAKNPQISVLGFASLVFGIASTLMLFGSIALFLGFIIMPLVLPLALMACTGIVVTNFKGLLVAFSAPSIPEEAMVLNKLGL